jgi:hypothetical protein
MSKNFAHWARGPENVEAEGLLGKFGADNAGRVNGATEGSPVVPRVLRALSSCK